MLPNMRFIPYIHHSFWDVFGKKSIFSGVFPPPPEECERVWGETGFHGIYLDLNGDIINGSVFRAEFEPANSHVWAGSDIKPMVSPGK